VPNFPQLRALALFGRGSPQCVEKKKNGMPIAKPTDRQAGGAVER
jgi:hypothetical protein